MSITLHLQHQVQTHTDPTPRTRDIAVMFGLSLDGTSEQVIIPPVEVSLAPGQVVYLTGISGGGKSTLLRLVAQSLSPQTLGDGAAAPGVVQLDPLESLPDVALVDALAGLEPDTNEVAPAKLQEVCQWLSLAGLNDAAVMLRRPRELSEGQRYRLRLARAMAAAQRRPEAWSVLLADEFGSSLDRTTARAMARSLRRWVTRSNVCLVAATAHDDLLESLAPDVLIEVGPGQCAVHRRAT